MNFLKHIIQKTIKKGYAHKYWTNPSKYGKDNLPEDYVNGIPRSQFLVEIINAYADKNESILEIGCNVGRNLNCLYESGYTNLYGIEINPKAVSKMKEVYPYMADKAFVYNFPIETIIPYLIDNQFDIVFSMAVLMHLPWESNWVFPEIARITNKVLITIEEENQKSALQFNRNYGEVFKNLKMHEICNPEYGKIEGLEYCTLRMFQK